MPNPFKRFVLAALLLISSVADLSAEIADINLGFRPRRPLRRGYRGRAVARAGAPGSAVGVGALGLILVRRRQLMQAAA
ncbi:hypothetical protein [Chlorobium sp. N1]|uniref:hypothetical protein n=1 Tax=Chlorobium sp. N1 TaxID=2491138 RepID=UPI00103EA003|nr:hypothetical protein [Chlorobium sp. N1]TCD47937.1 hypothetical protein E0L29_06580 [Chlorobium sp. N1]